MSQALRHAWAMLCALLLIAVLVCLAWAFGMRISPALVNDALADLAPLALGIVLVPLSLVGALGSALARRVLSPALETGASWSVDLLKRPVLAALVVALAVVALARWEQADADELPYIALVFFVGALLFVALAALVVRSVKVRPLAITASVAIGAVLIGLIVADRRGRGRLEELRAEALREVASLREAERAAVRPVWREPGVDANAADTYRRLFEARMAANSDDARPALITELRKAAAAPAAPLLPMVAEALEQARPDIAALVAASRSRRAFWSLEYEKGTEAPIPPMLGARLLTWLATLEGHERARAGDAAGAAERYLDVLRFGSDLGGGPMIQALVGSTIEAEAATALAGLVRSPRGAAARETIDAGLAILQPGLIEIGPSFRSERLLMAATGPLDAGYPGLELGRALAFGRWIVPWNAQAAVAVEQWTRFYRELEAAAANPAPRAMDELGHDFVARHRAASRNHLFRWLPAPNVQQEYRAVQNGKARVAAVRAAIALERRRAADGRYPADPPGPLPVDAYASDGSRLRYRVAPDGASYMLYSVGPNRRDDGGKAPDDSPLPEATWPVG